MLTVYCKNGHEFNYIFGRNLETWRCKICGSKCNGYAVGDLCVSFSPADHEDPDD